MNFQALQEAVTGTVEAAAPGVVGIAGRHAAGSGIVLAPGRVLTNAHNLRGGRTTVVLPGGEQVEGTLLGADVDGDLAVLAADTGDTPAPEWAGEGARPAIGLPVVALARPGGRGLRATFGYVSSVERSFRGPRGRRIEGAFEHTAPLQPGSSGGPVVDGSGRMLGLNTHRLGEGFYLAIPTDAATRTRVDQLAAGSSVRRRRLGIGVAPAEVARRLRRAVGLPEQDGLLVRSVEDESPAGRAGIREGDLITEAGGRALVTVDDLHDLLDGLDGDSLAVRGLRGAAGFEVTVDLS